MIEPAQQSAVSATGSTTWEPTPSASRRLARRCLRSPRAWSLLVVTLLVLLAMPGYLAWRAEAVIIRDLRAENYVIETEPKAPDWLPEALARSFPESWFQRPVTVSASYSAKFTDAHLDMATRIPDLRGLFLEGTAISNEGLDLLERQPGLEELNLNFTGVNDEGLARLVGLENLKVLDLDRSKVEGHGLVHLSGLSNLEVLILYGTGIRDTDLKNLAALERLGTLELGRTRVTNAGLAELAGLGSLEVLNLTDTRIDADGLDELAPLKGLFALSLEQTDVAGNLDALEELPRLTYLDLTGTPVRPTDLAGLSDLEALQHLRLSDPSIDEEGLEHISKLNSLKSVLLSSRTLTISAVERLQARCPELVILGRFRADPPGDAPPTR